MEIKWKDGDGGKVVHDNGKVIASVWKALEKYFMFWACSDKSGHPRIFWYEDTEKKAVEEAERILLEWYFNSGKVRFFHGLGFPPGTDMSKAEQRDDESCKAEVERRLKGLLGPAEF